MVTVCITMYIFCILITAIFIRTLYLIFKIFTGDSQLWSKKANLRTIVCIGSGGHTTEMLRILKSLNPEKFHPKQYILADNDVSSEVKIHKLECQDNNYYISRVPRSRNVKQSYISSIFSTLYAILLTFPEIYKFKPNVILCNGPGTCIPICLVAFFLRCLFLIDCRIVFVESLCRVRTLSLSGKILQFFADVFIIQWPDLRNVCLRAQYFGRLT